MRVPSGIMKIGKICNTDEKTNPATQVVRVDRLGPGADGDRCRAQATDGRSAIQIEFTEPPSEVLPGCEVAEKSIAGFTQLIPASAALEADRAIAGEYLIVDEDPPEGSVRVIVPQAVNQMWDGKVVDAKFPPVEDVMPNFQIIEQGQSEDQALGLQNPAVRVAIKPTPLRDVMAALRAATDCEGVFIDVPLRTNRPLRGPRLGVNRR